MATDGRGNKPARDVAGLRVNDTVVIRPSELKVRASRSGGAGGQHVNTSSTRVEIMWNVRTSSTLEPEQRARLMVALASRLDSNGCVRVVASDTRSQRQNRNLAEQRLSALVRKALVVRKKRKRTLPHRGAVEQRLAEKKLRSLKKRDRNHPADD